MPWGEWLSGGISGAILSVVVCVSIPQSWKTLKTWETFWDEKVFEVAVLLSGLAGVSFVVALFFVEEDGKTAVLLAADLFLLLSAHREVILFGQFMRDFVTGENGEEWKARIEAFWKKPTPSQSNKTPLTPQYVATLPPSLIEERSPLFPDGLRTEHAVICAMSGHGKTQMLQSLILDDLEKDRTVIVLDSQSQLIANLLNVVPANRLVYLSPGNEEKPLALNLFDYGQDVSLFEYLFASLDAEMTSKQSTLYRYVSRLVSVVPNANLETMRQILEPKGIDAFRDHITKLPPVARSFFANEYASTEYRDTRQQLARRLYTLLENDAFRQMFTSQRMRLNFPKEMNDGKVILINASKRILKGDAFKVFGRFFISQIARAIFDREHPYQKRVSIYIDEFGEYGGDEEFILELFTQARKFNVALTVAFQHLDMLPDSVRSAILTNTSIKVTGSLSAPDRRIFASEMGLKAENLLNLKKGQFMALFKGSYPQYITVELGRLEAMGTRSKSEIRAIEKRMAELYGEVPVVVDEVQAVPKLNFEDFKDRD